MENQLLSQLGINLPLFISQVVNFFILLIVLTLFVYKPLMKVVKERNAKIKEGLDKAVAADTRLKEVDEIGKERLRQADQKAMVMMKETENKAKVLDKDIQEKAEKKQQDMDKKLEESHKKQLAEAKAAVMKDAGELIKKALIKTVDMDPEKVDDALIKKAVENLQHEG